MVSCHGYTCCAIAVLHGGLGLDALYEIILGAGSDVEIGAQSCILLQPEFIVGFQPVYLAMAEGKICHSAIHFLIVCYAADLVVLSQAVFKLPAQFIVGAVSNAQNVDTISLQSVAELPVALGEVGGYKDKIHFVTLRLCFSFAITLLK